jgi:hypothetical protein
MARNTYESAAQALEDVGAFGEWLAQHAEEVVGKPLAPVACPLACWLQEVVGGQWGVTSGWCHGVDGWEAVEMPKWAGRFVVRIDVECGPSQEVMGWKALEVLQQVLHEEAAAGVLW